MLRLCCWKPPRFSEQIIPVNKYSNILSRQMYCIVHSSVSRISANWLSVVWPAGCVTLSHSTSPFLSPFSIPGILSYTSRQIKRWFLFKLINSLENHWSRVIRKSLFTRKNNNRQAVSQFKGREKGYQPDFAYAQPTLVRVSMVFLKFCFYELKKTSARTSLKEKNVD